MLISPWRSDDQEQMIKQLFEEDEHFSNKQHLQSNLMKLVGEVLLLVEPNSQGMAFNPRITLELTRSFKDLSEHEKSIFQQLYNEYHFNRHEEFWRQQALWKLPPLLNATNMLICGEDLGMIPASVAGVMQLLNILTLIPKKKNGRRVVLSEDHKHRYQDLPKPTTNAVRRLSC